MRKLVKKSMFTALTMLIISGVFASTTMAESSINADNEPYSELTSLYYIAADGEMDVGTPETVIKDTYWVDLEKNIVLSKVVGAVDLSYRPGDDKGFKIIYKDLEEIGVFPKYVLKPGETALKSHGKYYNRNVRSYKYIPNTGITNYSESITTRHFDFHRLGYLLGDDEKMENSSYSKMGMKSTDPVPDRENPYGFTESDVLSQDEVNDTSKLTVFGDIKEKGSIDSKQIKIHKVGDELKLDFSIYAPWFKRYMMGDALQMTRGDLSDEEIKDLYENNEGMVDSQIVYTLDIPNEVDLRSPTASLTGINDFDFKTEIKEESGKKKLVMSLRLKEDKRGKKDLWKNIVEKIRKVDTSNIKVSISGLYVNSNAKPETNISLRGTVGGYFEWLRTKYDGVERKNLEMYGILPEDGDYTNRTYLSFAAKQNNEGRDQAVPSDKPNLISYTFKLEDKKTNPPVNPKNPSDQKIPDSPNKPDTGRIDGRDRIETAINISKQAYNKAKTVIVVRHDLFPDSMTASVLAKLKDAPILLNPTDKLDSRVADEIKRLGAEEIIIVGGQNSVSERVREDLKAFDADKNVERIAGVDRYGTSEMVAKRVVGITGKKNTAVVASGQVFPDALSVGTFASREGYPILLVKKDSVPSQIQNTIRDLDINKTYIAGGLNTISKSTEGKLPNVVERMAGNTRYETSVAIAKSKFGASKEAYVASGEEFADALVISPVSGKYNRPTLLVSTKATNNGPVRSHIKDSNISKLTAIGGQRYVTSSIIDSLVN
nr:cell wall-binding repeat-containing protein [uncultured Peptostreptococcus sp.]